jgi:hypothetical protein
MNQNKIKILSEAIARTKTNKGDYCKQTVRLIYPVDENQEPYLEIHKLILSKRDETFVSVGYLEVKTFKDKGLYLQIFGIKISTLGQINEWIADNLKSYLESI